MTTPNEGPGGQLKRTYDPTEHLVPLADNGPAQPERILRILFDRVAPHLKPEVVAEADQRISEILLIRDRLREAFSKVVVDLKVNHGIEESLRADALGGRIPAVEDVCQQIDNPALRENVRQLLSNERERLVPDILERFGFLGSSILPRQEVENGTPEGRFLLLSETLPANFPFKDGFGSTTQLIPEDFPKGRRNLQRFLKQLATAQWMHRARGDFKRCVNDAFMRIAALRKDMIPADEFPQGYEMSADLRSKSLIELLEIIIDPNLEPRRRIDAFQVIRFAIGLFSIHNHPIYKASLPVQDAIHQTLGILVWDQRIGYESMPIVYAGTDAETHGTIYDLWREKSGIKLGANPNRVVGRRLQKPKSAGASQESGFGQVQSLLSKYSDVVANCDVVFFDSRAKSDTSLDIKVTLVQERVRQYFAKLQGYIVPTIESDEKARSGIEKRTKGMKKFNRGLKLSDRPTCIETIDDVVALTFGIILCKPLCEFSLAGRARVNLCLGELAEVLCKNLGFKKCKPIENNLWIDAKGSAADNPKRDDAFREVKVHAVAKDSKTGTEVPVELQIMPTEVMIGVKSPGSSAHHDKYDLRKAGDLVELTLPERVGGKEVYPRANMAGVQGVVRESGA